MDFPDFLFEFFSGLPRQGPGSRLTTRKAFGGLPPFPTPPRILDIGCGVGTQTLELASLSGGSITAVDIHQPFLDRLKWKAADEGFSERIATLCASMDSLDLPEGSFDLIWSEGAVYIMGFENGLRKWRQLLRPGGCMAVSEVAWIQPDPPEEIRTFWESEYPEMGTIDQKMAVIQNCGLNLLTHFTLPDSDWWDNYYLPIENQFDSYQEKFRGNPEGLSFLDEMHFEIDLFRKYSKWYGYEFYIMQKPIH